MKRLASEAAAHQASSSSDPQSKGSLSHPPEENEEDGNFDFYQHPLTQHHDRVLSRRRTAR